MEIRGNCAHFTLQFAQKRSLLNFSTGSFFIPSNAPHARKVYFLCTAVLAALNYLIGRKFKKIRAFTKFFSKKKLLRKKYRFQTPQRRRKGKAMTAAQYTTIKVRLYPDAAQAELFEKTFGCCRYIWNQMLSDQQRFYLETDAHFIPTPAKHQEENHQDRLNGAAGNLGKHKFFGFAL